METENIGAFIAMIEGGNGVALLLPILWNRPDSFIMSKQTEVASIPVPETYKELLLIVIREVIPRSISAKCQIEVAKERKDFNFLKFCFSKRYVDYIAILSMFGVVGNQPNSSKTSENPRENHDIQIIGSASAAKVFVEYNF